jgi:hypothetical protein
MNVYHEMWMELVKRLAYANLYSVNKNVTYQEVIDLMAAYEREFEEQIELDSIEDKLKEDEGSVKGAKKDKKK